MFQNFAFQTPLIHFGNNTVEHVGQEAKKLGAGKVLLVTGPNIEKQGYMEQVLSSLKKESIEVQVNIQGRKTPEPTTTIPEEVAEVAREMKADVIVGLGGGSILDVAKMAAALLTNPLKVRDYFGKGKVPNRGIPTILIPTTSGTGSEVTVHAIFLDEENNVKKAVASNALLPNVAIVDPLLTIGCPASVTASSGIDAFIHAAEPFISKGANTITDAIALEAISTITKWIGPAYCDGENIEARYHMALGSLMAGLVLSNAGTSLVHALGYPIGGEYHVAHGLSLTALILPAFRYNMIARQEKFVAIARAMGEVVEGLPTREAAELALDAIEHLLVSLNLPKSLTDLNITEKEKVQQWAIDAHAEQRLLARSVRKLEVEDIEIIYSNAF